MHRSTAVLARVDYPPVPQETPFVMLSRDKAVNPISASLLTAMLAHIENQALHTDDRPSWWSTSPTPKTSMTTHSCGTATSQPGASRCTCSVTAYRPIDNRIRAVPLDAGDPLVHEREPLFIGSHYASGVFARETDSGYDAGVCYQRDKIVDVTLPLVRRLKR